MLKQRIITALILFSVLFGAAISKPLWPLLLILLIMSATTMWEWLRLSFSPNKQVIAIPVAATSALLLLYLTVQFETGALNYGGLLILNFFENLALPFAAFLWVIVVPVIVFNGQVQTRQHHLLLSLFAIIACLVLWFSLASLYMNFGVLFLLSLMALIWAADSVAYFAGRSFGKHKLAPKVSPGKTLEGALGGILGALLWMYISSFWQGSFAYYLTYMWGYGAMLAVTVLLTSLSIVGDLFESLLKRRANVKDSSNLLPGHGGMFDRLDSLLPVAPAALLIMGSL